ncbi:MAG TPA: CoA transferase [Candidatus Binataceae bacterium]|nr:CoA transferase [Candidatus Binataceae bacterium]
MDERVALEGIKVVELPCFDPMPFFAAAMAGKLLADYGAEVIKIEPPMLGSAERRWGPFRGEERNPETNGLHLYLNTNKLGITLDLGEPSGRAHLVQLLADADILLNPNRPAVNEHLELDWRSLITRFPRLTVVSTTFFGTDSPYCNRRGGDLVATHMSAVGYGTPMQQVTQPATQPPLRLAGRQSDYVTGYTAAAAALCALLARPQADSPGMHVDVSQWLAMAQMCRPELSIYFHEAPEAPYRKRLLTRRKTGIQYMFPCKDGWVSFGLATNRHWRGTKQMMGNPEWAETEMFKTFEGRLGNSDALEALLVEWLSHHGRQEVFDLAQAEHVPSFPVNSPADVANNEQYAARHYFVDCAHPVAGRIRMPGAPMRFGHTPWRLRRPAPCLGEHNAEILGGRLGLKPAEIEEIAARTATLAEDSIDTSIRRSGSLARPSITRNSEAWEVESARIHSGHDALAARLPFEGLRVTDFGWIYALPYATAWLAALGADVIKIESSTRPDLVRFLSGTDGVTSTNRSGIFNAINFSKRSLYLNLSRPKAREIVLRLVQRSDIVTENFTTQTLRNLALAYDDLRRVRPDLIMLSGTSLGQTGPYADAVGWGPTNQAFAGTSYLTGYPESFPCAGGGTWPDFAVGIAMLFALTAALYHRSRTGEGQFIDVSMCEVVTSMMPEAMLDYFMNGVVRGPIGNRDPEMAPHGVFPVSGKDRWITIAIPSDAEFAILCDVLGIPGMTNDPRYTTRAARLVNMEQLEREIAARTKTFERDELVANLVKRNLCAGPVYSTFDLVGDAAFAQSGMMVKLRHKECGERPTPVLPVKFSGLDPEYRPAPLAGEHTDEILRELLDMPTEEITALRDEGVLA